MIYEIQDVRPRYQGCARVRGENGGEDQGRSPELFSAFRVLGTPKSDRSTKCCMFGPYDDLEQRRQIRAQVAEDGIWPPDNAEFVRKMRSEIFLPAPFMKNRGEAKLGPVYEMRIYTYAPPDIPKVIEIWGNHIEEREKYSPLVGAWYSELGALNTWIHMWAYESYDQRAAIREETRAKGIWPPPGGIAPLTQANKLLPPDEFFAPPVGNRGVTATNLAACKRSTALKRLCFGDVP